jgi:hypothetical protein
MNISLLTKWKWRLLSEGESIWQNILRDRYGGGESGVGWLFRSLPSINASPWWNDLMSVGIVAGVDRLHGIFSKKIGNGGNTSFWHDSWVGPQPLKEVFPRLFLISTQKMSSVLDCGRWVSGVWEWNFMWRRNLFVWEEERRNMLLNLLTPIHLSNNSDEWKCQFSTGGMFSVSSLYRYLSGIIIPPISLDPGLVRELSYLWKSLAPSKVIVFSWQLLLGRLPTKENLAKRGVVGNGSDSFCVLCPMELECEGHLFGSCAFASALWDKVFYWFDWDGVNPTDPRQTFQKFIMHRGNGKCVKGFIAVWHAVVWAIWKARNDLIFNLKVPVIDDVFHGITMHSWKWLSEKKKKGVCCSFYEWITYPSDCILR